MGQTAMTDLLTQLPAELFLAICELVHDADEGPYLARVSKAFVPFARQCAFGGDLCVTSAARVTTLVDVLSSCPGAAATVTKLEVAVSMIDVGQPDTKTFLKALSHMSHLKKLDIQCASRLCKAVLSPNKKNTLPQLRELKVHSSLEGWSNPLSPAFYRNIGPYENLRALALHVTRAAESLGRYTAADPPIRLPFRLRWLHLVGEFFDNPAACDLVNSLCSPCTSVLLKERSSPYHRICGMASFLNSLSSPRDILTLGLDQSPFITEDISGVLGRFSRVQFIEFSCGIAYTPLLPVLAELPDLTTLSFRPAAAITGTGLLALVDGPYKLKHLRRLGIDVEPGILWYSDETELGRFYDDLVKLVEICEDTPIEVEGHTVDDARRLLRRRRQREETERREAEARKRAGSTVQR
ncbi:hypothetical protein JCM10450v2_008003 [Rhodotorula kratochvilovae]